MFGAKPNFGAMSPTSLRFTSVYPAIGHPSRRANGKPAPSVPAATPAQERTRRFVGRGAYCRGMAVAPTTTREFEPERVRRSIWGAANTMRAAGLNTLDTIEHLGLLLFLRLATHAEA